MKAPPLVIHMDAATSIGELKEITDGYSTPVINALFIALALTMAERQLEGDNVLFTPKIRKAAIKLANEIADHIDV